MTAVAAGASGRQVRRASFYSWMACAFALAAFVGFAPTYWAPLAAGRFAANPVVHLHGIAFFAWMVFLIVQTSLVPAGRVAAHRAMGLAGISLATLLTVLGLLAAMNSLKSGVAAGHAGDAEAFLIVPLQVIATFAVIFTMAVANIRRPEVHKRLMLLAALALLNAPLARPLMVFVFKLPPPPEPPPVWIDSMACLASLPLAVPLLIYDWRTRGRPHPVWLFGLPVLMLLALAVIPISETAGWHAIARAFGSLAGKPPMA